MPDILTTDVLVIGGGGAGCRAAIAACETRPEGKVTLVSKGPIGKSGSTPLASWGYAAALDAAGLGDNPHFHCLDTINSGRGLSDPALAKVLSDNAAARLEDLIRYGARIETERGSPVQLRMPGETYPRSALLTDGGLGILRALRRRLEELPVTIFEDFFVYELLQKDGRVYGAVGLSLQTGDICPIEAKSVVLAGGGYSSLWKNSDNPPGNTGNCCALALGAGAKLIDLEMTQYYPTVMVSPTAARGTLLDYEVCLSPEVCGGVLLNGRHEPVLFASDQLPPRDILIQIMFEEVSKGRGGPHGGLYLDFSRSRLEKGLLRERLQSFIGGYQYLKALHIDLVESPVEVAPLMHYSLGGIRINSRCQTGVPGLFAAGESAGNLHGADRISGNALAETQVFGAIAGREAALAAARTLPLHPGQEIVDPVGKISALAAAAGSISPARIQNKIQSVMDACAGPVRDKQGLLSAIELLKDLLHTQIPRLTVSGGRIMNPELTAALEASAMAELAIAVCRAALLRQESRGHHQRRDFPGQNSAFDGRHTIVGRNCCCLL